MFLLLLKHDEKCHASRNYNLVMKIHRSSFLRWIQRIQKIICDKSYTRYMTIAMIENMLLKKIKKTLTNLTRVDHEEYYAKLYITDV